MKSLQALFSGIVIVVIPFFLLITAIRLLITPLYAQIEYSMPWFPPDAYGFTKEDRLTWAPYAINYLNNNSSIAYLGDLHFPDGQSLYNERELSHMLDVKNLVRAAYRAWWVMLIFLIGTGVWSWRAKWLGRFWRAISTGGWATIGLIVFILVATAISFQALFTEFHRIFFTGDTWVFEWSDTLIRLFPLPFWRDGFIVMGVFTILASLLCIFLGRSLARRQAD